MASDTCPFATQHNENDVCTVCKTFLCSRSEQEREDCPHIVEVQTKMAAKTKMYTPQAIGCTYDCKYVPSTKMYTERKANISAFRGCRFKCSYCAFQNTLRFQECEKCRAFEPHAHLEVLDRKPPKTKDGEFLTMALTGDIAFASYNELREMLLYCNKWSDRTFVLQTKDPSIFAKFEDVIQPNIIIGTTLETDNHTFQISDAPDPYERYESMLKLSCRKMVTVEPILRFRMTPFTTMIKSLDPEIVYIGYDSKNNHLPEPTLAETHGLIEQLRDAGIDVREKLLRKAWDEV